MKQISLCHQHNSYQELSNTTQKTTLSSSGRPEVMVFPKKSRWNMIFLVLSGKVVFLFPENMVLSPGREMKDDLSPKNTWKYDIFFKCSEKMVFSKELHWNMIFLVLSGKMVFFSPKNDIVSLNGEIRGNMTFSVHRHWRHKRGTTPLCPKKIKDGLIPQKNT